VVESGGHDDGQEFEVPCVRSWRTRTVEGKLAHNTSEGTGLQPVQQSIQLSPASQKPREASRCRPDYYNESRGRGHVNKREEKLQESNRFMNANTRKPSSPLPIASMPPRTPPLPKRKYHRSHPHKHPKHPQSKE